MGTLPLVGEKCSGSFLLHITTHRSHLVFWLHRVTKCGWHELQCKEETRSPPRQLFLHSCCSSPVLTLRSLEQAPPNGEKSSCQTTWPFSIDGKLRHLRLHLNHRWAESFKQSWILNFDPSSLDHTSCLMTKMMALIPHSNSAWLWNKRQFKMVGKFLLLNVHREAELTNKKQIHKYQQTVC